MSGKKKIIFDTDLGGDCDDVIALDLILSADKAGECELIGVTYSETCRDSVACIHCILKQHGYRHIPVGRLTVPEGKPERPAVYAKPVADKFSDADTPNYESAPDAVKLLRKLLSENSHVTLIATGSMSNLCGLMQSRPDEYSELDGMELMKKSVDEIAIMGCNFWHQDALNPDPGYIGEDGELRPVTEWNIFIDVPAARYVFGNCPVPLVCCPFELGFNMFTGKPMYDAGLGETPDSYSFQVHGSTEVGRHSWDPATALYGVYGAKPWFYKTIGGRIIITESGVSHFNTLNGGDQRLIQCALPREQVGAEIDRLIMRLFDK